jgi:hypothetical protein
MLFLPRGCDWKDALAAHHRRVPARLLASGWLDLDDLGAEI